jgi:hypothetical protein
MINTAYSKARDDDGAKNGLVVYGWDTATDPLDWKDRNASRQRTPEWNLCAAILEDAIETITRKPPLVKGKYTPGYIAKLKAERLETLRWFASEDTEWVFSFVNVCHVLNINPGYVRSLITKGGKHGPNS